MMNKDAVMSIMLFALLACSSCTASRSGLEHLIIYEDTDESRIDADTTMIVDVERELVLFYDRRIVDYSSLQPTEIGSVFRPKIVNDLFYDDANQILVPATARSKWSIPGLRCRVVDRHIVTRNAIVECADEARKFKRKFQFDSEKGVTAIWIDCISKAEGCKYNLKSSTGILSSRMRDAMVAKASKLQDKNGN